VVLKSTASLRSRLRRLLLLLGLSVCCVFNAASAARQFELKFATLAPSGSTWMNLLEQWANQVTLESGGRLVFKFYPGGVQGDEPDVLKKMRFGQLQGGLFTGYGIGSIYSPARVLELPFTFNNYAEYDFVRGRFMPEFEQGFRDSGYELLGFMEVGFVHFFSKEPIGSLEDMKKRRIWLWQGDPLGEALFEVSGISPVPLSIIDVFTSLSTGLIDTVYCTPLAALALQWFTKTEYITNRPMAVGIGAIVVSRRFYQSLPQDLQLLLLRTGRETGERMILATRRDNQISLDVLRNKGMKFVMESDEVRPEELFQMRDKAAAQLAAEGYIPESFITRTRRWLEEFRGGVASPIQP
jgi:TRAP-type C4-dicarboxylate transport system substrate-binding protein